jgi:hypothetical protein
MRLGEIDKLVLNDTIVESGHHRVRLQMSQ